MTISINQQVDYLWKKVGFGLTKTSTSDLKNASNESIVSSPFLPGDKIWTQSSAIPSIMPSTDSGVVKVYNDTVGNTVKCDMDITAPVNRTWLTNLIDWIPPVIGPTYQPKVYLAPSTSLTPMTDGTQLFANGSDNDDEWFFDFQSGVLHFIGTNLPNQDFTGKSIFISGARYNGVKGVASSGGASFGNITIDGSTISSTNDLILSPASSTIYANSVVITGLTTSSNPSDAATVEYVNNAIGSLSPNSISQGNSNVTVTDAGTGLVSVSVDGTTIASYSASTATIANLGITGTTISSTSGIVSIGTTGALQVSVGTTAERPSTPVTGYMRYNTTVGAIEFFDGTTWVATNAEVESQILVGDSISDTFTLNKSSIATGIMVMINGVVQIPDAAYQVSGTTINFAEPPLVTDIIEIRYICQLVSSNSSVPNPVIVSEPGTPVSNTPIVVDMFSTVTYRTARYTISATSGDGNFQTFDVSVIHDGANAYVLKSNLNSTGGSVVVTFTASVSASLCSVSAVSTNSSTVLKMQKTYFEA